jgi:hypothetical protein
MMKNKIMVLIVAIFLIAGVGIGVYRQTQSKKGNEAINPTIVPVIETRVTPEPEEVEVLKQKVEKTAAQFAQLNNLSYTLFLIENIEMTQNWARGTVTLGCSDHCGPLGYHFLAQQQGGSWVVAIDSTQGFKEWIQLVPTSIVPQSEKDRWLKKVWPTFTPAVAP